MRRFSPDFTMIPINGMRMDHQAVSAFFHGARASRPGLKIVVDSAAILAEWRDGAAVSYRKHTRSPAKRKPRAGRQVLSVCRKRKSSGGTSTRRRSRKRRRPKKRKGPIKRLSLFKKGVLLAEQRFDVQPLACRISRRRRRPSTWI